MKKVLAVISLTTIGIASLVAVIRAIYGSAPFSLINMGG